MRWDRALPKPDRPPMQVVVRAVAGAFAVSWIVLPGAAAFYLALVSVA
jgi:hypothetical protein